jgi:hypothetical protein
VTGQGSTNLVFTILGFHTIIVIGFHHHCWWSSYHDIPVTFHIITYNDKLPSKDPWKLELFGKVENKGKLGTIFIHFETTLKQIEGVNNLKRENLRDLAEMRPPFDEP